MSIMASWWAQRGNAVTLVTLADAGEDFHTLRGGVCRVALGLTG